MARVNFMSEASYQRILLKLSGEALMGEQNFGIDPRVLSYVAGEIKSLLDEELQIASSIVGVISAIIIDTDDTIKNIC